MKAPRSLVSPPRCFGFLSSPRRPDRAARRSSGIALIWAVIFLLLLVALMGLAIDTAYVLYVAHQLQNCPDASSLAGAQKVRSSIEEAREAAVTIGLANAAARDPVQLDRNDPNEVEGDVVVGKYSRRDRTFTPQLTGVNAVKVNARRTGASLTGPVPLFFAPIFGLNTANVARSAIAMTGGGTGAGLIALDPHAPCGLDVQGNVTLNVLPTGDAIDGDIQVNSDHPSKAVCGNGNPVIQATNLNVQGEDRFVGNVTLDLEGDLNVGAPPIPDPLAFLPPPAIPETSRDAAGPVRLTGGGTLNLEPGLYTQGIYANNGVLNLAPGVYVVDGVGFNISGNTIVNAEGVMFYVLGTGVVDLTGTGDIHITPPNSEVIEYVDPWNGTPLNEGTYDGVTFFQARNNRNQSRILGTSLLDLEGTLYFPSNHVYLSGTGDGFGNQLIANTVEVAGDGIITINYDGRFPAPGNHVFLVQ
jgi:Flp pilus assembly protein TadG